MPIRTWRELQYLNDKRQKGEALTDAEALALDKESNYLNLSPEEQEQVVANNEAMLNSPALRKQDIQNDYDEFLQSKYDEEERMRENPGMDDYGAYKHDLDIPYEVWKEDPQDYRAKLQSPGAKLGNGARKMFWYGVSTFLDNTVGLIDGLLNVAIDADTFATNEGRSFVDTPFAEAMQNVRDWSERRLPNYRTAAETEDQDHWWRHMNANFWGDTFIKNLGFTLGAGLSGMAYGKGARLLFGKTANKAYRAAVAAAGGDMEAEAAFQKVLQGEGMNIKKVYDTFNAIPKTYKAMDAVSQITGSVAGALGESRTEALMAAKEYHEEYQLYAEQKYEQAKAELLRSIMSNPDYIAERPVYDGYGNQIDTEPTLNHDGYLALQNGLNELQSKYRDELNTVNNEAEQLSNTTFALNMPLLTLSNWVMFGRAFAGGFKTQAKAKVGGVFGNYTQKGSLAEAIGRGAINSATEGMEELSQKVISEGSKDIARKNLGYFYDGQYDKNAIRGVSEILTNMLGSAGNVVFQPQSWEEFAVGALTGAIGMPVRGGWAGGIYGGVKEGLNKRNESRELAETLNNRIAETGFKDYYEGLIRHYSAEISKDESLRNKDKFAWQTENDKQLLSDVIMFAKAGRLNELSDYVESLSNLSDKDIQTLKPEVASALGVSVDNVTDTKVKEWIGKRVDDIKTAMRQYSDFHDSIDFLSFGTTDEKAINELIYTRAQLENFEKRYNTLLDATLTEMKPRLNEIAREVDKNGNPTENAKKAQNLLASEESLRTLFGGMAFDIHGRGENGKSQSIYDMLAEIDSDTQKRTLNTLEQIGLFTNKPNLKQQVEDLQNLVKSRQEFYTRLFDPTFRQSIEKKLANNTPEKAAEEIQNDAKKQWRDQAFAKISTANNLKEYIQYVNEATDSDGTFDAELKARIDADENLKKYSDIYNDAIKFAEAVDNFVQAGREDSAVPGIAEVFNDINDATNRIDFDTILSEMPEGTDPKVAIASKILEEIGDNKNAQSTLRSFFEKYLGDVAKANSLGVLTPAPAKGKTGSSESASTFDRLQKELENINDYNNVRLNKIASGNFQGFKGLSDEDKTKLTSYAAERINYLKKKAGVVATTDGNGDGLVEDEKNPAYKRAHDELVQMDTQSILGTPFSVWERSELKKGRVVLARTDREGTKETLSWLAGHNVQDFIDSGALAELAETYKEKTGKELPIYFLANPHYVENNLANNPFAIKNKNGNRSANVILAVAVDDDTRPVLNKYGDVVSDKTFIQAQDNKQYQPVGIMWNPHENDIKNTKPAEEQEAYMKVVSESQKVWEYVMNQSIYKMYNEDTEGGKAADIPATGKWYVAKQPSGEERMYTHLNYIQSGRNDVLAPGKDEYEKIELSTSLSEYVKRGGEYHFAMSMIKNGMPFIQLSSPTAPAFPPTIVPNLGSVWIATKEANGAWAWTALTVKRANEYNFAQDNATTRELNNALDTLFAPIKSKNGFVEDFQDRSMACRVIDSNLFFFDRGNVASFVVNNGNPAVVIAGQLCNSKEEVINELKKGKFRFEVEDIALMNKKSMDRLIDDGILTSEMRSFIRRGASIGVDFLKENTDNDGKVVSLEPTGTNNRLARTAGSTIVVWDGGNDNTVIKNVRIGDTGYSIASDGTVSRMGPRGRLGSRPVDNPVIISQVIAIGELMSQGTDYAGYQGKVWESKTDTEHTFLFERVVNGITVHMMRKGDKSALVLVWDDSYWDDLKRTATPIETDFAGKEPAASEEKAPEAAEQPLTKEGSGPDKTKGWGIIPKAPTAKEKESQDDKDENRRDCD